MKREIKCNYSIPFTENDKDKLKSVGPKTRNLIEMRRIGLPVPEGYAISDKVYDIFIRKGEIPNEVINEIQAMKTQLGGKIAIRSSANIEDGKNLSMAGIFETVFVEKDDDIENALVFIYNEANSSKVRNYLKIHDMTVDELRLSIIVQKLITSDITGVIYTAVNGTRNLIQYFKGYDAEMLDEGKNGVSMLVDENGIVEKSSGYDYLPIPHDIIKMLVIYSNRLTTLFDRKELDIEFSYTNGKVHFLQARPLTTPIIDMTISETLEDYVKEIKMQISSLAIEEQKEMGTRTSVFSNSNYSELLPHPKEMDIGIYTYIFTGRDNIPGATQKGRNELGYKNGGESIGIINYIAGRTYYSIARNAALYYIGVPPKKEDYFNNIVNSYLEKITIDPQKGKYPQMGLYIQKPNREVLKEYFDNNIEEYYETYRLFSISMDEKAKSFFTEFQGKIRTEILNYIDVQKEKEHKIASLAEYVIWCNDILEHLRNETCVCFVKTARFGFYYSQMIIDFLKSVEKYSENECKKLYSTLTQGLENSEITKINLEISASDTYEDALKIALKKVGHFSVGEMLEIHHSTMKENLEVLEAYVKGIREDNYSEKYKHQKEERLITERKIINDIDNTDIVYFKKIVNYAQKYMALRETVKYIISLEYSLIKRALDIIEGKCKLNVGEIYHLYPRELLCFVNNINEMHHLIDERKNRYKYYSDIDISSIITEEEIKNIRIKDSNSSQLKEAKGTFLANGEELVGVIVNCDELTNITEIYNKIKSYKKHGEKIILVAKQMNLSHDPCIALADGLILENSGIVAHGAQRARELGKGAIGGIFTENLMTGNKIFFSPEKMYIKTI